MAKRKKLIKSLKLTAAVYATRTELVDYVREYGQLPDEIYPGGFPIAFSKSFDHRRDSGFSIFRAGRPIDPSMRAIPSLSIRLPYCDQRSPAVWLYQRTAPGPESPTLAVKVAATT